MKKIYKYTLKPTDFQILELPKKSNIISVIEQKNQIVLYAIVNDDISETELYDIIIKETGHDLPENFDLYTFLGSVNLINGSLIFHVFYKKVE